MAALLLDGRTVAAQIRNEIAAAVTAFVEKTSHRPALALVRAGEDPASVSYARMIQRTCGQVGVEFRPTILAADTQSATLVDVVADLSADSGTDGVIIQEPLPHGVDRDAVIAALQPAKDVDGVHPVNAGRLLQGSTGGMAPATPAGGLELLDRYGIALEGAHAVVVGRSNVVGRPMALLLLHRNATVTICHSRTVDLAAECRRAQVLVAATGRAGLISGDMVAPGAVVVDFGVNYVGERMVGDVDFEAAAEKAAWITPVPGGTGPMTNVMLMRNVLKAASTLRA
ncbi:MAG: bifunctional 5,10-methylenetetrahydrofolate dehydrogenase/5,10-methenyltetrahydrofolate cyclohydrolase [Anaerolineae bacterium]